MKTIKDFALDNGISKQKVYRYIKQYHINDVVRVKSVMYIDDTLETTLLKHFNDTISHCDVHHDVHQITSNDAVMIQMLKAQIEEKDRQLANMQELLKNQQILTLQARKQLEAKEVEEPKYEKVMFGLYRQIKDKR